MFETKIIYCHLEFNENYLTTSILNTKLLKVAITVFFKKMDSNLKPKWQQWPLQHAGERIPKHKAVPGNQLIKLGDPRKFPKPTMFGKPCASLSTNPNQTSSAVKEKNGKRNSSVLRPSKSDAPKKSVNRATPLTQVLPICISSSSSYTSELSNDSQDLSVPSSVSTNKRVCRVATKKRVPSHDTVSEEVMTDLTIHDLDSKDEQYRKFMLDLQNDNRILRTSHHGLELKIRSLEDCNSKLMNENARLKETVKLLNENQMKKEVECIELD